MGGMKAPFYVELDASPPEVGQSEKTEKSMARPGGKGAEELGTTDVSGHSENLRSPRRSLFSWIDRQCNRMLLCNSW